MGRNHHVAAAVGEDGFQQLVVLADVDGVHAVGARTGIGLQRGLLHHAVAGNHHDKVVRDELLVLEGFYVHIGADGVVGFYHEDVLDGASLGGAVAFRNLIYLEPVAAALLREQEQGAVRIGDIDVLDKVFVTGGAALHAHAAAVLGAEFRERGALDITQVADGNHLVFIGIEVLGVEFVIGQGNLRAAGVSVAGLEVLRLFLDDAELELHGAQDGLAVLDELHELVVLCTEFLTFQADQLTQAHFHDGCGLQLGKIIAPDQNLAGLVNAFGFIADDVDNLVDDVHRFQQAF